MALPPPPIFDQMGSMAWVRWFTAVNTQIDAADTVTWANIDFTGSNITSLATKNHDDLDSKDGGGSGEFFHMTQAEHTAAKTWAKDCQVTAYATNTSTGDGQFYFHVPEWADGMNLVYVHGEVITAGTTGTLDVQIYNVDNALDMLSTKLTIDSGETGSDTAAASYVINGSNDHVNTNDVIRIDVDAVHTTPAQGLIVTLGFQLP